VKKGNGVRGRVDPSHAFGGVQGEGSSSIWMSEPVLGPLRETWMKVKAP